MTNALTPFSVDGYRAMIEGILGLGYTIRSFHDFTPDAPHLILRHDIDQSIQVARVLAEAEMMSGWQSTWFVLIRSEMYNPWSPASVRDLRAMARMGHEIGLHLDASLYAEERLAEGAEMECRALEDIIGMPVRTLSFHRPSPASIGGNERLAGRLNVYAARFAREIGYCSDSRGAWHHGHPWYHEAVSARRPLQLLTHAIWWVGPDGHDSGQRLADFLETRRAVLDADLSANNKVWAERIR